jgi:hypothetical protein
MMKRFGLYKRLPINRIKTVRPATRWIPDALIGCILPVKIGDVKILDHGTVGEVWASALGLRESFSLPKGLNRVDVVGIEGFSPYWRRDHDHPVMTNGNALELILYLEQLLFNTRKEQRSSKIKVAVGGVSATQISTVARLLSREVHEMILIGREPFLQRLAEQIMAETGLAARILPDLPDEHVDRIIGCGEECFQGISCDRLFTSDLRSVHRRLFPWMLQGSCQWAVEEIQSFAAAEAMLMVLGEWDKSLILPGRLSVAWVDYVEKLIRDIGFPLPWVALDTPPPVGYNVNNF